MDMFLKIVGGLAIAAVAIIVILLLLVRWFFRSALKDMANKTPSTIDLKVDPEPKWADAPGVRTMIAELEKCGYVRGDAYTVEGMPGVSLVSFEHPVAGAHGCIYDHPTVGNWIDLCADFETGVEYTISTAPLGGELDTRPGVEKVFSADPIAKMHEQLMKRSVGETPKPVSREGFRAYFCDNYARTMEWRNSRQGITEAEFMRIAKDNGKGLTEDQLREAFIESKLRELRHWSDEALEAFEASTTLSVAEWKKYEHCMFIFGESFHSTAYLKYLTTCIPFEEGEEARYQEALDGGLSLRGLLDRISSESGHQFTKLGEVTHPMIVEVIGIKFSEKSDTDEEKSADPAPV